MTTKFDIIKLKSLAAMGNVDAMYTLGGNYLYGIGVDVDLEQAHSYLEKSCRERSYSSNRFDEEYICR